MKKLNILVVGVSLLMGLSANALSGKNPPRNDGSGNTQCAWYDSGKYEEHGSHLTQDECLHSGHGSCSQRCFVYEHVCKVQGIRIEIVTDKDGKPMRKDVTTDYSARHRDEFRAREMADHDCLMAWPRQDSCRSQSCYEDAIRVN